MVFIGDENGHRLLGLGGHQPCKFGVNIGWAGQAFPKGLGCVLDDTISNYLLPKNYIVHMNDAYWNESAMPTLDRYLRKRCQRFIHVQTFVSHQTP